MKIALICLLALTFTNTNALDKKQLPPPECLTISDSLQACLDALTSQNPSAFCGCRDTLIDYYNTCLNGIGVDTVNQAFDQLCGNGGDGGDGGDNGGDGGDGGDNGGDGGDGGGNGGVGDSSAATVGVTLSTIVSAVLVAVGN